MGAKHLKRPEVLASLLVVCHFCHSRASAPACRSTYTTLRSSTPSRSASIRGCNCTPQRRPNWPALNEESQDSPAPRPAPGDTAVSDRRISRSSSGPAAGSRDAFVDNLRRNWRLDQFMCVGASLLAKNVNDYAWYLAARGALASIASKLAPTRGRCFYSPR